MENLNWGWIFEQKLFHIEPHHILQVMAWMMIAVLIIKAALAKESNLAILIMGIAFVLAYWATTTSPLDPSIGRPQPFATPGIEYQVNVHPIQLEPVPLGTGLRFNENIL